MSKIRSLIIIFWVAFILFNSSYILGEVSKKSVKLDTNVKVDQIEQDNIILPDPKHKSNVSIEEAISSRRSKRNYKSEHINIGQLSQILWAAQGITGQIGDYKLRAAPSAGALYPIEIYVVLPKGVYLYLPQGHKLKKIKSGDLRSELAKAALNQWWIRDTSCDIVITAVYERTMAKYGQRGVRYAVIEAGAVTENVYLQVESLELGTVSVGAFNDRDVQKILNIPDNRRPLIIMPIGYP